MHREEEGKSRLGVPRRMRRIIESVATLPRGPTDGELGSPESPQGAEFKQDPVSPSRPCGIGSERTAEPSSRWDRSSKTTRDISNRTCSDENVPQNQSRACATPMEVDTEPPGKQDVEEHGCEQEPRSIFKTGLFP